MTTEALDKLTDQTCQQLSPIIPGGSMLATRRIIRAALATVAQECGEDAKRLDWASSSVDNVSYLETMAANGITKWSFNGESWSDSLRAAIDAARQQSTSHE